MNRDGVLNAIKQFVFPQIADGETIVFVDEERFIWRITAPHAGDPEWQCEEVKTVFELTLFMDIHRGIAARNLLPTGRMRGDRPGSCSEVIGWAQRWKEDGSAYLVSVMR